MKVVRLTSENVKRLRAVDISPGDDSMVIVGGKNEAGKSSVLDSIAYACGGEKLVPSQPIRNGETEAKIVVDLGDLIVTRRFSRDASICVCGHPIKQHADAALGTEVAHQCQTPVDPNGNLCDCKERRPVFGETHSVLTVTNKDGAKYPSPQAVLDKLYGVLAFDPLAFSHEQPKKQNEILRRLVNLDFTRFNEDRKTAVDRRAMNKKSLNIAEVKLSQLTKHTGVPDAEVPLGDVSNELLKADEYRKLAESAEVDVRTAKDVVVGLLAREQNLKDIVTELERKLSVERKNLESVVQQIQDATETVEARAITAQSARAVVPDVETLRTRLQDVETTNAKVRANLQRAEQERAVNELTKTVKDDDERVKAVDEAKANALATAAFPVPGLGLSDEGVTYEGLPFEEVSASVQLRVSVAIGLALNPTLKVLLIRNGNLLDDDNLKVLGDMAAEANAQVWCEYVTSNDEGVTVMLEDGHVR